MSPTRNSMDVVLSLVNSPKKNSSGTVNENQNSFDNVFSALPSINTILKDGVGRK